jgi:archaellum component FlaC
MTPETISGITTRLARIEGKLDQYLQDQGRRCAAHDSEMIRMSDRIKDVESSVDEVKTEFVKSVDSTKETLIDRISKIETEQITKRFIVSSMIAICTITVAIIKVIEFVESHGRLG